MASGFFDKEFYLDWVRNAHPLVKEFLEKENVFLREFLSPGCVLLDAGCGYGRTISAVADIPA